MLILILFEYYIYIYNKYVNNIKLMTTYQMTTKGDVKFICLLDRDVSKTYQKMTQNNHRTPQLFSLILTQRKKN